MKTIRGFLALSVLVGCANPGSEPGADDVGEIAVALETVPPSVGCVKLAVNGSTYGTYLFSATTGTAASFNIGQLSMGTVYITPTAYNIACASVTSTTPPSWIGDQVVTTVTAGLTTNIDLKLRPAINTVATVDFTSPAVDVVVNDSASYALMEDGTVRSWGANSYGQLGDGSYIWHSTPVPVLGLSGVVQLVAGAANACALLNDGTVRCWGAGSQSVLGNNSTANAPSPVAVSMAGLSFTELVAGSSHFCGLATTGGVYCWGYNNLGQLGDGTTTNRFVPTAANLGGMAVSDIFAGGNTTCALSNQGQLYCWGENYFGEFGNGSVASYTLNMQSTGFYPVVSAAPGYTLCALTPLGTVTCAGNNQNGQIGDGTTTQHLTPTAVPGMTGVTSLATSTQSTCATRSDGTAWCWGANGYGQLGNGTITASSTPSQVVGLSGATTISAAYSHICARKSDGSVWCWGSNAGGELGDGTLSSRFVATRVSL
jgi:alpha-tubulin suppressor-like RCC1 family protein